MRVVKWSSLMAACVVAGVVACDEASFPVLPAEEFTASLVGTNEVPAVTTTAGGSAIFAVIQDTILSWRVDVADIDSTILAHIHAGPAGTAGPVIVDLFLASTVNCKQNADTALQIVSSSVGDTTTITTAGAHRLTVGSTPLMRIAGHAGSTPSLNGEHTATVTGTTTFTIPVNVTTAGGGGTAQRFILINVASLRCRVDYTGILAQAQIRPAALTHAGIQNQNADTALQIVSSSVGNPTTITAAGAHRLTVGSTPLMRIAGHAGSTPSLNAEYTATVTGTTTFTIPVNVTTAGTGGTAQRFTSYGATPRERFDSLISLMRTGDVYVNVHTRTNPGGEVRGQLGPR